MHLLQNNTKLSGKPSKVDLQTLSHIRTYYAQCQTSQGKLAKVSAPEFPTILTSVQPSLEVRGTIDSIRRQFFTTATVDALQHGLVLFFQIESQVSELQWNLQLTPVNRFPSGTTLAACTQYVKNSKMPKHLINQVYWNMACSTWSQMQDQVKVMNEVTLTEAEFNKRYPLFAIKEIIQTQIKKGKFEDMSTISSLQGINEIHVSRPEWLDKLHSTWSTSTSQTLPYLISLAVSLAQAQLPVTQSCFDLVLNEFPYAWLRWYQLAEPKEVHSTGFFHRSGLSVTQIIKPVASMIPNLKMQLVQSINQGKSNAQAQMRLLARRIETTPVQFGVPTSGVDSILSRYITIHYSTLGATDHLVSFQRRKLIHLMISTQGSLEKLFVEQLHATRVHFYPNLNQVVVPLHVLMNWSKALSKDLDAKMYGWAGYSITLAFLQAIQPRGSSMKSSPQLTCWQSKLKFSKSIDASLKWLATRDVVTAMQAWQVVHSTLMNPTALKLKTKANLELDIYLRMVQPLCPDAPWIAESYGWVNADFINQVWSHQAGYLELMGCSAQIKEIQTSACSLF
jgi:hypothetical protein